MDAERLAALLDGRLSDDERTSVLAELASSDEAYDALVDAMAVLPELGEEHHAVESGAAATQPMHAKRRWHASRGRWLALAATLVIVAALPWLWSSGRGVKRRDPMHVVALLATQSAGLPSAWDGRPWTTTRGAGDPLTAASRAARLGARLVDLELAVRTRDARTGPLAAEIAVLLRDVPAGSPAAAIYREVSRRAGAPRDSLAALLERGRVAAAALAGVEPVALGAWVETARLAAAAHDVHFFHDDASRDALTRASQLPDVAPAARAMLDRVRQSAATNPPDWTRLESDLTALLAALGG